MVTNNAVNTFITVDTNRQTLMTLQPSFRASLSAQANNVTGDGTAWTIPANTESFDQGGDYNTGTYTFTAPVDGIYTTMMTILPIAIAAAHTTRLHTFVTTGETLVTLETGGGKIDTGASLIATLTSVADFEMDASDTLYFVFTISGGAKVIDVYASTKIQAALVC